MRKEAPSVKITRGPDASRFVWDVLSSKSVTFEIFRKLRAQHSEWMVDCVLLLLPSADKPLAERALLPGGLQEGADIQADWVSH